MSQHGGWDAPLNGRHHVTKTCPQKMWTALWIKLAATPVKPENKGFVLGVHNICATVYFS